MAFKRRFKRGFRRTPFRKLARKRYTWIQTPMFGDNLIGNPCNAVFVPFSPDPDEEGCSQFGKIILLPNTKLQDQFSDRVTVVRSVGQLQWCPSLNFGALPPDFGNGSNYETFATFSCSLVAGLMVNAVEKTGELISPDYHLFSDPFDFSQARWKRRWFHDWLPSGSASTQIFQPGTFMGVCSQTSGTIHGVTTNGGPPGASFEEGTGIIDVESDDSTINTTCAAFLSDENTPPLPATITANGPRWWRQSMNWRKRLPLRENEQLELQFEYGIQEATTMTNPLLDGMFVFGRITLLLEIG